MTLKYKLLANGTGILTTKIPLILDRNKDCTIQFITNTKLDIAFINLVDGLNQKTSLQLVNGGVVLPKKLWRTGQINITVDLVDDGNIIKTWYCQPLSLNFKDDLDNIAITLGADLYGSLEAITGLETAIIDAQQQIQALTEALKEKTNEITALEERVFELENRTTSIAGL